MPLKYANPRQAADEAYHYYIACKDRYNRTRKTKDFHEMIRARKDSINKTQYARNHKDDFTQEKADPIGYLRKELDRCRDKNIRLRRMLKAANEQLSLPVDERDLELIQTIAQHTDSLAYSPE